MIVKLSKKMHSLTSYLFKGLENNKQDVIQALQVKEIEKTELQDELDDLMKLRAQLELQIKDLEDDQLSGTELEVTCRKYFSPLNPFSNHLLSCF
jgi:cell division protein FtsB